MRAAWLFIFLGLSGFVFTLYTNSRYPQIQRVFSTKSLLSSSWEKYRSRFINQDGRVEDLEQHITTSEGQSYALLRAVWMDDRDTFDLVWKWTKENLKRPNDNLFGWSWGKREDGSFGFTSGGGENSASDADVDIALALILGSRRWNHPDYQLQAKAIIKDIWQIETDLAGGKKYLVAGNWAKGENQLIINPSYFAPYAFRIFARIDREQDWPSLIEPGYDLLKRSSQEAGLPADWVSIDRASGKLNPSGFANLTTDYAFDALRVPWRVALDYQWNREAEAADYLSMSFNKLVEQLTKEGRLVARYSSSGDKLSDQENPAMYATSLAYLSFKAEDLAKKVYEEKILRLYSNDTNSFREDLPYYDQNWLWFGVALYHKQLTQFND